MSATRPCLYKVRWSTAKGWLMLTSGELPYAYVGMALALQAGRDWEAEMVAINGSQSVNGSQSIVAIEYQWEVVRIDPPIPTT